MTEFRVLGPIEVRVGGRALDLGPPKQRAVFAALVVDAGRPVRIDTLIDRVWPDAPPAEARNALYAHIMRIRRLLAATAPPVRLDRGPDGYVLAAGPDAVDALRFRRLVARSARPGCGDAERAALLRDALALWRGEPLSGLGGDWADAVRERYRQHRVEAAITWARAEIRLGHAASVIAPLTELADEYPLVEPVVAALMRALCAAGRRAEALDRFALTRRRLADALGTDPGADLRRLHQAALLGELETGSDDYLAAAGATMDALILAERAIDLYRRTLSVARAIDEQARQRLTDAGWPPG